MGGWTDGRTDGRMDGLDVGVLVCWYVCMFCSVMLCKVLLYYGMLKVAHVMYAMHAIYIYVM